MHTLDPISSTLTTALILLTLVGDFYGLYLIASLGGVGWLAVCLLLPPAHLLAAGIGTWSLVFGTPAWLSAVIG